MTTPVRAGAPSVHRPENDQPGRLTRLFARLGALDGWTAQAAAWTGITLSAALLFAEGLPASQVGALCLAVVGMASAHRAPWALVAASPLLIITPSSPSGSLWAMWSVAVLFLFLFTLRSRGRNVTIALGVAAGAVALRALLPGSDGPGGMTAGLLCILLGAAAQGTAIRLRHVVRVQAEERSEILERSRQDEMVRAVADERRRIARDLHDGIAHHVAVIGIHVGLARAKLTAVPDEAERALAAVQAETRAVLAELHDTLLLLRDDTDTDLSSPAPGYDLAGRLVETFDRTGLAIRSRLGEVPPLAPQQDLAAYRVIQEGLTNAHRHGTGHADLTVRAAGRDLLIEISNPVPSERLSRVGSGLGLVGLRERVRAAGGSTETSCEDGTYRLHVTLPLGAQLRPGADR